MLKAFAFSLLWIGTSALAGQTFRCADAETRASWLFELDGGMLTAQTKTEGADRSLQGRIFYEDESASSNSAQEQVFIDEEGEFLVVIPRQLERQSRFTVSYLPVDGDSKSMECALLDRY